MKNQINGKLPPQAVDLEEAVLGAIMSEKDAIMEIADIIHAEMFYVEANRMIFQECAKLSLEGSPIDLLTVTAALRASGNLEKVGGVLYLTQIVDRVVSSSNIEYHARIVAQKYIQRELIKQSSKIIDSCYTENEDVFDIMSSADFHRDELLGQISTRKEQQNFEVMNELLREITISLENGEKDVSGVPSGIKALDKVVGGWQNSDLIILAARPAMGKTSFALTMAINAALGGFPVAVFSLEMSSKQLAAKELSIISQVPFWKIRKRKLDDHELQRIHSNVGGSAQVPIHWDDTPGISITELCAKAKRMKRKHGIKMIVIDYLQLITTGKSVKGSREQEVGFISRTLKGLAKELDIPVIALSQLSRAVESRPANQKRPLLSDLRESGSIEQDADIVTFLYRPEYYGITETEDGGSTNGLAELIIAKHRNGECEDIPMRFDKETTGFQDWEQDFPDFNTGFNSHQAGIQPSEIF